jgi:hypothetical protein
VGRYVEVYVDDEDFDVDGVLEGYSTDDWADLVATYRDHIAPHVTDALDALLNDPVKRLEVIVTLRNQGYTVESA